ncbi:MAG: hypothetical protein IKV96_01235 [Firmicutes bacterium]|nr:hypothetical protein [Bacillota bacterium]
MNMAVVYGIIALCSILLLAGYSFFIKEKDMWLMLLFVSVFIVNTGYLALSVSKSLSGALMANRISYFGSVFLPLCMFMSIVGVCRTKIKKWITGLMVFVSFTVFLLAASPGYLNIYYSDVSLIFVNGMAKLEKVYGPLHFIYLVYLVTYFGAMLATILIARARKNPVPYKHAALLLIIVFLNIGIWGIEQMIYSDFEFLSVSYIVSELLMLMLYSVIQEYQKLAKIDSNIDVMIESSEDYDIVVEPHNDVVEKVDADSDKDIEVIAKQHYKVKPDAVDPKRIEEIMKSWDAISMLTARETDVLKCLLENRKRKDIADYLFVTEHTVKKHTSNIFSKLQVTNRRELYEKADKETFKG